MTRTVEGIPIEAIQPPPGADRLEELLRQLLPAASSIRLALGELADYRADLRECELAAIGRAADRRVREFSTGRILARRAMAALGLPPDPIPKGPDRAPQWPDSCIGSITHAGHIAAAAVARRGSFRGLGIDLELAERVGAALHPKILTGRERAELPASGAAAARAGSLRFSAKEAVYKAVHPCVGRFIGFREVEVVLEDRSPAGGTARSGGAAGSGWGRFRLRYVGDHAPNRIMEDGTGCYCFFEQYVFTLFIIP